jgi:hypothetical protein
MINSRYLKYLIANCFPLERTLPWNLGKKMLFVGILLAVLLVFVNHLFICALETRCLKPACNRNWWAHGLHWVVVGPSDWNSAQIPSVTGLVVEELPNTSNASWLQLFSTDKFVILCAYVCLCVCVCRGVGGWYVLAIQYFWCKIRRSC